MLAAFARPGRFWRGNIHGHSDRSDGGLSPAEVCRRYRDAGYDFVSVTDHFIAKYDFPITDTTAERGAGFTTVIGAEVHAPATSAGERWHVLAVGLPLDFRATGADETGPSLAWRCAAAGAFVAIAHPHWYQLTLDDALSIDAAHAVEVYNHTCALHADRGDGLVMLDAALAAGRRLDAIAVDDSHWHGADGFGGWVMVKAFENTPEALLDALKSGAFYASQGPEFHDIRRDGDMLEIVSSPVRAIVVTGSSIQAQRANGEGLTRTRLSLEPFKGGWARAALIDAYGRRAWSNPLWLD